MREDMEGNILGEYYTVWIKNTQLAFSPSEALELAKTDLGIQGGVTANVEWEDDDGECHQEFIWYWQN